MFLGSDSVCAVDWWCFWVQIVCLLFGVDWWCYWVLLVCLVLTGGVSGLSWCVFGVDWWCSGFS